MKYNPKNVKRLIFSIIKNYELVHSVVPVHVNHVCGPGENVNQDLSRFV